MKDGESGTDATKLASGPGLQVPASACDCHVHVFGDPARYPLAEVRNYTPAVATDQDLRDMLTRVGIERVVLVQPSAYGTDNACMLDAMATLGASARGVAVLPPTVTEKRLAELHDAGVRGVRINAPSTSAGGFADLIAGRQSLFSAMAELGWHLQCFAGPQHFESILKVLKADMFDVVLDHMGGPLADTETVPERIDALARLLGTGRCWIKMSGPYRVGNLGRSDAVAQVMDGLPAVAAMRLLWGSDWPHTPTHDEQVVSISEISPFQNFNPVQLLDTYAAVVGDADVLKQILVDNPVRLYGW